MPPDDQSAVITCTGETLAYRSRLDTWSIPVSAIKLVAEYTNSDGPGIDDYFLVFLTAPEDGWHEASFYAGGRNTMLQALGEKLGAPLQCGMCNSATYRSRILWPARLRGQPLMDVSPAPTAWRKLFDTGARDITLTRAAREALETSAQQF
jgi:hypothetical protein